MIQRRIFIDQIALKCQKIQAKMCSSYVNSILKNKKKVLLMIQSSLLLHKFQKKNQQNMHMLKDTDTELFSLQKRNKFTKSLGIYAPQNTSKVSNCKQFYQKRQSILKLIEMLSKICNLKMITTLVDMMMDMDMDMMLFSHRYSLKMIIFSIIMRMVLNIDS